MKGHVNLQDTFLNQLRKRKVPVTIYLVNGFQLRGIIYGFDSFTIILSSESQQMVYKHAISTITPQTLQSDLFEEKEEKEKDQNAIQG